MVGWWSCVEWPSSSFVPLPVEVDIAGDMLERTQTTLKVARCWAVLRARRTVHEGNVVDSNVTLETTRRVDRLDSDTEVFEGAECYVGKFPTWSLVTGLFEYLGLLTSHIGIHIEVTWASVISNK